MKNQEIAKILRCKHFHSTQIFNKVKLKYDFKRSNLVLD